MAAIPNHFTPRHPNGAAKDSEKTAVSKDPIAPKVRTEVTIVLGIPWGHLTDHDCPDVRREENNMKKAATAYWTIFLEQGQGEAAHAHS